MVNKMCSFIDLFSGIGGFRLGFEQNGFKCVFSSDIDESCREVYYSNFGDTPFGDITKINTDDIPDFDVLCAGFPCQPFSISGKMEGFEDTRGTLFFDICRILERKKPKVVVLENVKHLVYHNKRETFNIIVSSLESLGYNVSYKILNATNYGVAQNRERIIIVGSTVGGFNFSLLKEKTKSTVQDILDKDGEFDYLEPNEYTLLNDEQIKVQPSGLMFCGYRNKNQWKKGVLPNTEHLSRCHRQPNRIYSSLGIHPTISSQEISGRFWIYIPQEGRVRKLTISECYKLMGFPKCFLIDSNKSNAYRQCGNSVVVPMVSSLAKAIKERFFNEVT